MTALTRREALLAVPGIYFLLAACQSAPTRTDSLDEVREAVCSLLESSARDPEDADRLLAIYSELEEVATAYVHGHVEFVLDADHLMKDRSAPSGEIRGLIEANVQDRQQLGKRLLYQQDRLRQNLGRDRWDRLVMSLNDPERMERVLGRRG